LIARTLRALRKEVLDWGESQLHREHDVPFWTKKQMKKEHSTLRREVEKASFPPLFSCNSHSYGNIMTRQERFSWMHGCFRCSNSRLSAQKMASQEEYYMLPQDTTSAEYFGLRRTSTQDAPFVGDPLWSLFSQLARGKQIARRLQACALTMPDRSRMEQRNEQHPHGGSWLREIVFGLNDGLVTTLVFLVVVSGVPSSNLLLIMLGEVMAGGVSMALGGYLWLAPSKRCSNSALLLNAMRSNMSQRKNGQNCGPFIGAKISRAIARSNGELLNSG
jgi:hypothetical protein